MAAPRFSAISVSVGPDAVGHLALARPAKGNAINREMWSELGPGLEHLVTRGARAVSETGAAGALAVRQVPRGKSGRARVW